MFLGINNDNGMLFFTSDFRNTTPRLSTFLMIPQAWSLGIEVLFYIIAPFIVRRNKWFIISIIFGSLSIRIYTYYLGYTNDPWTYRFFLSELALFLLGTMAYRMWAERKFFNNRNKYFVVIFFFIILIFFQYFPLIPNFYNTTNWAFYFLVCFSLPYIFEVSKSSVYDKWIGELSYPVYISHTLVIMCLIPFISYFKLDEFKGEITVFITILFSILLVKVISEPIEKIRQYRVNMTKINTI
jgi:peptidoglycan/LPS O-acetylase OafA/YrhL